MPAGSGATTTPTTTLTRAPTTTLTAMPTDPRPVDTAWPPVLVFAVGAFVLAAVVLAVVAFRQLRAAGER